VSRARTAIRGRFGRAIVVVIVALVLSVLPAPCPCATATGAPAAGARCHAHPDAPAPRLPAQGRDCAHCQVAVTSAPAQHATSPPATTSRPLVPGKTSIALGVPTARVAPAPRRASRPPARAILLEKHVLIV
jgi:hypothetical protein